MTTELILPEYGRNIQNMVEIAKRLPDRNERNRCARTIIKSMGNLFPYLRDNEAFNHKLWDHLALMARFKLDIDYPYEINPVESKEFHPDHIELANSKIAERHYGRFLTQFIEHIASDDSMRQRQDIIILIANYMKRCYNMYNIDIANDATILNDLYRLSGQRIDLRSAGIKLQDQQQERKKFKDQKNKKNNRY